MKPFWLYMLRCADGSYYVGHTDDLEERVGQHQSGAVRGWTSTRRPVQLVYSCEFSTRDEAFDREMQLKGWRRAKKEALIRGDWEAIQELARAGRERLQPARASTSSARAEAARAEAARAEAARADSAGAGSRHA